ncbi:WecB/TagA/CpsF family glycosyltransferase [Candidatus Uhrbacteria bacterium]|nr:WecB/TagA/CpsF family glycosyltransferase [Candidatus Uhrbacteria bacterium]
MATPRLSTILGTHVDRYTRLEFRMFLQRAASSSRVHRMVTLNPEIALAARRDPRYAATVRTADVVTIDGVGIALALRLCGGGPSERITGTHVLEDVCTLAMERESAVTFLLREDGLTSPPLLRAACSRRWPTLRCAIATVNPSLPIDASLVAAMNDAAPTYLLVNFGHPIQELWLTEHLDRFRSVRVAAGIGGAVDYLSGAAPRPPAPIHRLGLEWAWRLIRQPWRARRIARAAIVFPLMIVLDAVQGQQFIMRER